MLALILASCTLISDPEITDKVGSGTDGDSGTLDDSGDGPVSDADGDGFTTEDGDCDDTSASAYPGATETWYDGVDSDCSGGSDYDQDGDGYDQDDECDDADSSVYPDLSVSDPWYDGLDQNCDGNDGDQDGDGYCLAGYSGVPCSLGDGDCDDTDGSISPGAPETWYDGVDQDCAGGDDYDQDGDGHQSDAWSGDDCDDENGSAYPGATETWYDGADTDCSGTSDYDQDGDSYDSSDYAGGDCDDTRVGVNPSANEDCATAYDDDCDGDDNDPDADGCFVYYLDGDGDGYGDVSSECLCSAGGDYSATTDDDCDDANDTVNPGATEVCENGVDDDCDGGSGGCSVAAATLASGVQLTGERAYDIAGNAVSHAGDLDGDGFGDILIAAYQNSDGATAAGAVYVVRGSSVPTSLDLSVADAEYSGESAGDQAGQSVAGAGDVDDDGLDDLLVGTEDYDDVAENAGVAYLILGQPVLGGGSLSAAAARYTGSAYKEYAGWAVCGAGDTNGDGFDDILVGAYNNTEGGTGAGAAHLLLGSATPANTSLDMSDASFTGQEYDAAGISVASAGDVNGDGLDDMLIGAYRNGERGDSAGAAYLVLGRATAAGLSLEVADAGYYGDAAGDHAGWSTAGAVDVDADGYDDLVVGAYGNDDGGTDAGAAYLVLGTTSPTSTDLPGADARYMGVGAGDEAGISVAGAGDVDADGFGDVVVGAWLNDNAGASAGAAYVVLGGAPASAVLSSAGAELTGVSASEYAGASVSGAQDVDGDGYSDVLVGAQGNGDGGSYAGAAYLILGTGL